MFGPTHTDSTYASNKMKPCTGVKHVQWHRLALVLQTLSKFSVGWCSPSEKLHLLSISMVLICQEQKLLLSNPCVDEWQGWFEERAAQNLNHVPHLTVCWVHFLASLHTWAAGRSFSTNLQVQAQNFEWNRVILTSQIWHLTLSYLCLQRKTSVAAPLQRVLMKTFGKSFVIDFLFRVSERNICRMWRAFNPHIF